MTFCIVEQRMPISITIFCTVGHPFNALDGYFTCRVVTRATGSGIRYCFAPRLCPIVSRITQKVVDGFS